MIQYLSTMLVRMIEISNVHKIILIKDFEKHGSFKKHIENVYKAAKKYIV